MGAKVKRTGSGKGTRPHRTTGGKGTPMRRATPTERRMQKAHKDYRQRQGRS